MTICIAAICTLEKKEYVVAITDKMLTNNVVGGGFEHPSPKYKILNGKYIAMLSGDPLIFPDLVPDEIPTGTNLKNFAIKVKDNMKATRLAKIDEEILSPFSTDRKMIGRALEKEIPNLYIDSLLKSIANFRLETEIILAGVENNKASVFYVSETGVRDLSDIGFESIGSGEVESTNTLLFQRQHRKTPLKEGVYNVFKAKRNAEAAEGVGVETDMIILNNSEHMVLSPEKIEALRNIYNEEMDFGKQHKALDTIIHGEV